MLNSNYTLKGSVCEDTGNAMGGWGGGVVRREHLKRAKVTTAVQTRDGYEHWQCGWRDKDEFKVYWRCPNRIMTECM